MAAPHTPQLSVEVGFGNSHLDDIVTWVDITRGSGFHVDSDYWCSRGRPSELDRFSPARCSLRVTDASRDLDPTNLSGPYVETVTVQRFPVASDPAEEVGTSLGTDNAVSNPSGVQVGDLLLAFVAVDQNGSATGVSTGTGSATWTELFDTITAHANVCRLACYARIATGSDALVLSGASQDYVVSVFRVVRHGCATTADVEVGTPATNSTGQADPPSLAAGSTAKWLWVAAAAVDFVLNNELTAAPSGFTAVTLTKSANSNDSVALGVATLESEVASLNPGTFTDSAGSRSWVANTIAVPPVSTSTDRTQIVPGTPLRVVATMPSRALVFDDPATGPTVHSGWRVEEGAITTTPSGEYSIPTGTVLRGPAFNFDGASIFQFGTAADGASPNHDVRIVLANGGYIGWNLTGVNLTYAVNDGGSTADDIVLWNDTTMRYLRIRISSNNVNFERSADGSSWTNIDTYTRGTDFANTVDWSFGYLYVRNQATTAPELDDFEVEVTKHTRFTGTVDSWVYSPLPGNRAGVVSIGASDAFGHLANTQLPQRWQAAVEALDPDAWYPLSERDDDVAHDASGHGLDGLYPKGLVVQGEPPVTPPMGNGSVRMAHAYPPDFYGIRLNDGARRTAYPYTVNMWMKAAQEFPRDVSIYASGNSLPGALFTQGPAGNSMWCDLYILPGETTDSGSFTAALNWRIGFDWYSDRTSGRRLYFRSPLGDANPHMVTIVVTGDEGALCYVDGVVREAVHYLEADFASELDGTPGVWIGPANYIPFPTTPFNTGFWGLEGFQDEVTIHSAALTAAEVLALYEAAGRIGGGDTTGQRIHRILDLIGWPDELRLIDTGTVTLAPDYLFGEPVLSYLQNIETTEGGALFIGPHGEVVFHDASRQTTRGTDPVVFDDTGSGVPIMGGVQITVDDSFVYTGATVTRDGGLEQEYRDATATARYGARDWSATVYTRTDIEARMRAAAHVERYKYPRPRVGSWRAAPEKNPGDWPAVLNLALGDTVRLTFTPLGSGDQYDEYLDLEHVSERVSGGGWEIEWAASPQHPAIGTFFTWDGASAVGWDLGVWR